MTSGHRRILVVTLVVLCVLTAFIALAGVRAKAQRMFDSAGWIAARDLNAPESTRLMMVDDLVDRQLLSDLTKDQIVALLGEPTSTDKWQRYDLVYVLGPQRSGYGVDFEWLVIDLDSDGRAGEIEVVQD